MQKNQRYRPFYSTRSPSLSKPGAEITHNAMQWQFSCVMLVVVDVALCLRYAAVLHKTCKQTLSVTHFVCNRWNSPLIVLKRQILWIFYGKQINYVDREQPADTFNTNISRLCW